MTTKMTRETFEAIIAQDLQWLLAQEETVARRHIEAIVKSATGHYYPHVDAPGLIALAALARYFDKQHADKSTLAEELRGVDSASYPEHQAIADTYEDAATMAWELCGGRPTVPADPVRHAHHVNIDARELAKLIELATHHDTQTMPNGEGFHGIASKLVRMYGASIFQRPFSGCDEREQKACADAFAILRGPNTHAENEAEFAETNRVLNQSAERIRELVKERDEAYAQVANLKKQLANAERSVAWHNQQATAAVVELGCVGMTLEEAVRATTKRFDDETSAKSALHVFDKNTAELLRTVLDTIKSGPKANDHMRESSRIVDNVYFGTDIVRAFNNELAKLETSADELSTTPAPRRIFLGMTFERELADGSRENVDPSQIRIVMGNDPTQLVPVASGGKTS